MVYTPEEKGRMDQLLSAFTNYVAESDDIDIAYTEKIGYVRLIIAESADNLFFPLRNFDDMLQMFFFDILSDEVNLAFARNPKLTYRTMDYTTAYHRLRSFLGALGADREYALKELDNFIYYWKNQKILP